MIKKITTKLVLKKETVSNFEMQNVNAGYVAEDRSSVDVVDCRYTCDPYECRYTVIQRTCQC